MKIYVYGKGVVFIGKAWEIRQKLKEDQLKFHLLTDWLQDNSRRRQ